MSELRFDGRVVVVTGGARGMGREHAKLLAQRGAKVVVNDIGAPMEPRNTDQPLEVGAAQTLVDAIRASGGEAVANTDSVATRDGARAVIQHALDAFGRLDAVIHNAGVVHLGYFDDLTLDDYETVRAVHLDGAFALAHFAWPHFRDQNYGRLVFISSRAGIHGTTRLSHYGAAKAGQIGLAKCLAHEGREYGIKVNVVSPAASNDRSGSLSDAREPDKSGPANTQNHPAKSLDASWWQSHMRPEQVSPVVLWLAHETCTLSGEILETGGGYVGRVFFGNTEGYANPNLTLEDVAANIDDICDDRGAHIFSDTGEAARDQLQKLVDAGVPPFTT